MGGEEDVTGCSTVVDPARRLQDLMDRMLVEYSDVVAAGSIVRCVARCTRVACGLRLDDAVDFLWVVESLARNRMDARRGLTDLVLAPQDPCDLGPTADLRLQVPSLTP